MARRARQPVLTFAACGGATTRVINSVSMRVWDPLKSSSILNCFA